MISQPRCLSLSVPALTLRAQPARGLVQVIGFPRKTSESVVYQLSGTGFQDRNAVSVQRLLGGELPVNAHLFFQPGGMDSKGGGGFKDPSSFSFFFLF